MSNIEDAGPNLPMPSMEADLYASGIFFQLNKIFKIMRINKKKDND